MAAHFLAWLAATTITLAPDPCPVRADLAPAPGVAAPPGEADLPSSEYRLPDEIDIPLELYLAPPAPFGTKARLDGARIDLKSGRAAFASGSATGRVQPPHGRSPAPPAALPWMAGRAASQKGGAARPPSRECP